MIWDSQYIAYNLNWDLSIIWYKSKIYYICSAVFHQLYFKVILNSNGNTDRKNFDWFITVDTHISVIITTN